MAEQLTGDDFNRLVRYFRHTAWRLETLPVYLVDDEQGEVARYRAGEPLTPPPDLPWYRQWLDMVAAATAEGKRIERVRVMAEPPTLYQRWESWVGRWNERAGERISYITRSRALDVGLPLHQGDWWLFDSQRLARMAFDPDGRPLGGTIITDQQIVQQACEWRDLAARHSVPAGDGDAA